MYDDKHDDSKWQLAVVWHQGASRPLLTIYKQKKTSMAQGEQSRVQGPGKGSRLGDPVIMIYLSTNAKPFLDKQVASL